MHGLRSGSFVCSEQETGIAKTRERTVAANREPRMAAEDPEGVLFDKNEARIS